jgi:hypothetical protein
MDVNDAGKRPVRGGREYEPSGWDRHDRKDGDGGREDRRHEE